MHRRPRLLDDLGRNGDTVARRAGSLARRVSEFEGGLVARRAGSGTSRDRAEAGADQARAEQPNAASGSARPPTCRYSCRGHLAFAALAIALALHCGCNKGLQDQVKQKEAGRDQVGLERVQSFIADYEAQVFGHLPDKGKLLSHGDLTMITWRKRVAELHLERPAMLLADELEGTAAQAVAKSGMRLIEGTRDYWLSRPVRTYRESPVGLGALERVLGTYTEPPWNRVADLEGLMPYWELVWRYNAEKHPDSLYEDDYEFYERVFELTGDRPGYGVRDRGLATFLCSRGVAKCDTVFDELRPMLVMAVYLDKLDKRLADYRAAHGDFAKRIIDRLALSTKEARQRAKDQPRGPDLPNTLASRYPGGTLTVVVHNDQAEFHSEHANHSNRVVLLKKSDMDPSSGLRPSMLAKAITRQIEAVKATVLSRDPRVRTLEFQVARNLPVRILTALRDIDVDGALLVGRRYDDPALRRAATRIRLFGAGLEPEVDHGDTRWRCRADARIGTERVVPSAIGTFVTINKGELRMAQAPDRYRYPEQPLFTEPGGRLPNLTEPPTTPEDDVPAAPRSAQLTDAAALSTLVTELARQRLPILVGVHADETVETLHQIINALAYNDRNMPETILAICETAAE